MLFVGFLALAVGLTVVILDIVGVASGAGAFINVIMAFGLLLLMIAVGKMGHHYWHRRNRFSH